MWGSFRVVGRLGRKKKRARGAVFLFPSFPEVSEDAARVMIMKRGRIRGLVFYDHIWYEQKGLGSYYMETSVYSISHRLHRENGMYFVILTDLYRFIVEMTYFLLLLSCF